jgi:hypothetical protein
MHSSEDRHGKVPAERLGDRKVRQADSAANGAEGTGSSTPCTGAFKERQETHRALEPALSRRHLYQRICGARDETRAADAARFCSGAASQTRRVPGSKPKPIGVGWSNDAGRHLRVFRHLSSLNSCGAFFVLRIVHASGACALGNNETRESTYVTGVVGLSSHWYRRCLCRELSNLKLGLHITAHDWP